MSLIGLLTAQEERLLRLRAQGLSYTETAHLLGSSEYTVKHQSNGIYRKLEAANLQEALVKVGWVVVPGEPIDDSSQCGYVGRCGRAADHRGQHGGFRAVPQAE